MNQTRFNMKEKISANDFICSEHQKQLKGMKKLLDRSSNIPKIKEVKKTEKNKKIIQKKLFD
jgi:hypothetical protein